MAADRGGPLDQAEFCCSVLGLDVEVREIAFFDLPPEPFHTILCCGVLYVETARGLGTRALPHLRAPSACGGAAAAQ